MVKIKPLDRAKEKFRARTSVAGPDYEFGIKNPRTPWDAAFADAIERILEGLREAIEKGMILGGVKRRGHAYWSERAARKGPARWREETPKQADGWFSGFKPFGDSLAALVLERKRRKGDPANIDARVKPVVDALRKKKAEVRGVAAG
ncbi:MAG: hypothetical protein QW692_03580 [Nitrososphaerota archaeon]